MVQRIITLLQVAFLLLVIGCRQQPAGDGTVKKITFRPAETIDMGQLLGRVHFVQLENHPESAFTDIDKMVVSGSNVFMLDKRLEAVFCFDTTGRFRFRIQRIGRGPGEYRELDAMWLEPSTNELWLQSFWPARIMIYDLDGNLLREKTIRWAAHDMVRIGQDLLAGYNTSRSDDGIDSLTEGVFLLDKEGGSLGQALTIGDTSIYWSLANQRNLAEFEDGALLLCQSDTLFRILPDGRVIPDIHLDWGKLRYPDELRGISYYSPRAGEALRGTYVSGKDQLVAFGPIRLFRVFIDGHMELAMADLVKGEGIYSTSISSSATRIPLLYPLARSEKDQLVGMYDIELLLAMKESRAERPPEGAGNGVYHEMDSLVESALRQDRPVLWFADIKKELLTQIF
jgi:hypothetical protein